MGSSRRPLPLGLPLPASVQTFIFWRWPLEYLRHCRRRYGAAFTLRATSQPPLVFLADPADINSVFGHSPATLRAGEGSQLICPIVGERSFMLADDERHDVGRRNVLAEFGRRGIERHARMVATVAANAVASWPTDRSAPLYPRLRALTLEVVLRSVSGRCEGELDGQLLLLRDRILAMLDVTASPVLVEPHLRRGPGRWVWQRFLRDRALVDESLYELISEAPPSSPLLCLQAARHGPAGRVELRDNLMSLVLAGHETTAAQLAWAVQLLAYNPAVQRRLASEVIAEAAEDYLTATIQETLRHRCVFVFAIPRRVARTAAIGDALYRAPVHLLPCIYLVHHDPQLYRQPQLFQPERFLTSAPDPRRWLPWGGGGRRCPGVRLATLEMKEVLRAILAITTIEAGRRSMERPSWRSVIVTPHAGSRVVLRRNPRNPSQLFKT
jgi:cytochrome P450